MRQRLLQRPKQRISLIILSRDINLHTRHIFAQSLDMRSSIVHGQYLLRTCGLFKLLNLSLTDQDVEGRMDKAWHRITCKRVKERWRVANRWALKQSQINAKEFKRKQGQIFGNLSRVRAGRGSDVGGYSGFLAEAATPKTRKLTNATDQPTNRKWLIVSRSTRLNKEKKESNKRRFEFFSIVCQSQPNGTQPVCLRSKERTCSCFRQWLYD